MAESHRPNPAFEKESVQASLRRLASSSVLNFCCDDSIIMQTLNSLIQVKYQSIKASPFDCHDVIMPGEISDSLPAGALAAISLLAILDPILGCITSAVCAFSYGSRIL
uniref:Uncharacterized protein n=1 Tax=Salix viminalis TaxID=40686 RepID=A0A6N2LZH9_SALVM